MMIAPTRIGMAMEDFIRTFDEAPFEFIDGERVLLMPTVAEHGELLKLLYKMLLAYEERFGRTVVLSELPFVLADDPQWVKGARVPDIMVYRAERMADYKAKQKDWKRKPYILVPNLCIEIVSPNDSYLDVEDKVNRYLEDGVHMVWVVNPRQKSVTLYSTDAQITRLTSDNQLTGGDLMPEFAIQVSQLFEE